MEKEWRRTIDAKEGENRRIREEMQQLRHKQESEVEMLKQ